MFRFLNLTHLRFCGHLIYQPPFFGGFLKKNGKPQIIDLLLGNYVWKRMP